MLPATHARAHISMFQSPLHISPSAQALSSLRLECGKRTATLPPTHPHPTGVSSLFSMAVVRYPCCVLLGVAETGGAGVLSFSLANNRESRENWRWLCSEASLPSSSPGPRVSASTHCKHAPASKPCLGSGSGRGSLNMVMIKKIYLRMYEIVEILPSVCLHFLCVWRGSVIVGKKKLTYKVVSPQQQYGSHIVTSYGFFGRRPVSQP